MPRTTPDLVKGIVDTSADDALDLMPFIEAANVLVTKVCLPHYNETTDASQLELIERWLAAHHYCILSPRESFEGAGAVQANYESKVDLGLDVTRYGQTAMRFDTSGALAALNNAMKKAATTLPAVRQPKRWKWLGTE